MVLFVEVPFLLKICPLTDTFTNFIRHFDDNLPRCGFYLLMSVVQWLSLTLMATSLIVVAVFFLLASSCYALAAVKNQEYLKSSIQVGDDSVQGQVAEHVVRGVL